MHATNATTLACRQLADLPSPGGLPLLGNLHQLDLKVLHQCLERWAGEHGPVYTFGMGPQRVFVTSDPEHAQTALRDRPDGFRRLAAIRPVFAELGLDGVFSTEGDGWLPQRRLVTKALSLQHLAGFLPTMQGITARLHRRWQQAAQSGQPTDAVQDLMAFAVDVTATLSLGADINTLENDDNPIQRHLEQVFPMINRRINLPLPYWRWMKLPMDRRLDASLAEVRRFVDQMIERARAEMARNPDAPPSNLLQALLRARDEPGSGIGDDEVYANVVTLLLAGEDTTAHAMAWALFYLASDEPLQERLHQQARSVLGASTVAPDMATIRALPAFEGLVDEALRLRPVVPIIFLETVQERMLGDVRLPAGTPVFLITRPAMLDEQHFGDAQRLKPERWMASRGAGDSGTRDGDIGSADHSEGDGDAPGRTAQVARTAGAAHNPRAFVQFGAGPRVCPGRHLATLEMRMAMSMLLRSFRIRHAGDPEEVREQFGFTMMPQRLPLAVEAWGD